MLKNNSNKFKKKLEKSIACTIIVLIDNVEVMMKKRKSYKRNVGLEDDIHEFISNCSLNNGQKIGAAVNIALRRAMKVGPSFFLPEKYNQCTIDESGNK